MTRSEQNATTGTRAFVASHFAVSIKNSELGFLRMVDGPNVKTDPVEYKYGHATATWRQPGRLKYEDIQLSFPFSMFPPWWQWINEFVQRNGTTRDGEIKIADFNYRVKSRRIFYGAYITSFDMPQMNASSKEAAYPTIKISPQRVEFASGGGDEKLTASPGMQQQNKLWLSNNFQLGVDGGGLEDVFKRCMQIDAFSVKQQILEYPVGHLREPVRVPGRIEQPNIVAYIPSVDADPLYEYCKKNMIDYQRETGTANLTGAIRLLANDQSLLATINLAGIDVSSVETEKSEAQGETVHRVKVGLICESMSIEVADQEAVVVE